MKSTSKASNLSRRERQLMDILFEMGEATVQQVLDKVPEPPSYSTIRTLLRKLEEKGHVGHREEALKYVYFPLMAQDEARQNAIQRLVRTFFSGSPGRAANALLGMSMKDISPAELEELEQVIQAAKNQAGKQEKK